jgi:uncharacterized protein (TIGR02996 family)
VIFWLTIQVERIKVDSSQLTAPKNQLQFAGKDTMSLNHTFLEAVRACPKADEPRIAFADWLEERCDPLGEFIRVQCLLAQLPTFDARVLELERRERELLAEHEDAWAGTIADCVDFWVFRRGFIEEIGLSADRWLAHAEEIFALAPIQEVHLTDVNGHLAAVTLLPELSRVRFLDLSNNPVRDGGLRVLAGAEMAQLRGLNLSCTGLGDAAARTLALASGLGRLHELYLSANHIGDAGGMALAAAPHLRQLARLHLDYNTIGRDAAHALRRRFGDRVHV